MVIRSFKKLLLAAKTTVPEMANICKSETFVIIVFEE